MPRGTITALITGAGAPGVRGTLYALHHNKDGVVVRSVGVDAKADAVGRFWMDAYHQVPYPEDAGYVPRLLRVCKDESVEIVMPQTTREVAVLSRHRADFAREGVAVMVADAAAVGAANDKARLLVTFAELGLPHPAFHLARSEDELVTRAHQLGYPARPVVVKPPVSNGMRGFRILRQNAWDAERFLAEKPSGTEIALEDLLAILHRGARWPELLVMEYLPGPEYSVDAFLGEKVEVAIPRLRRSIVNGISFENMLEFRQDLGALTLRVARHIGLTLAFGFQFKLDEQGLPQVLECNPRIQGTMVASLFSGVNVIWLALKEAMGEAPAELPEQLRPASFYRFWGGLGVGEDSVAEI